MLVCKWKLDENSKLQCNSKLQHWIMWSHGRYLIPFMKKNAMTALLHDSILIKQKPWKNMCVYVCVHVYTDTKKGLKGNIPRG